MGGGGGGGGGQNVNHVLNIISLWNWLDSYVQSSAQLGSAVLWGY